MHETCGNMEFNFCDDVPDDGKLLIKEDRVRMTEEDIMAQFSGTAEFKLEPPDYDAIGDPLKHSFMRRFAIEKYTILQLILQLCKLVSVFTIVLLARVAYNYTSDFKDFSHDNRYITRALRAKDTKRKLQGKPYLFPLRRLERKVMIPLLGRKMSNEEFKKTVKEGTS